MGLPFLLDHTSRKLDADLQFVVRSNQENRLKNLKKFKKKTVLRHEKKTK